MLQKDALCPKQNQVKEMCGKRQAINNITRNKTVIENVQGNKLEGFKQTLLYLQQIEKMLYPIPCIDSKERTDQKNSPKMPDWK